VAIGTTTDYKFPDADGDGIDDRWDSCLDEKENFNGYLDWDGCPDVPGAESTISDRADSDGDGYPDSVDSCPTAPETWNKYNDSDGCPDTAPEQQRFVHDDDLDGIINDVDKCPLKSEDYIGIIDGCPEQ
ncbi:MAG: thrombospondin type 3 repeat-containing protein, partial [Nitrosarchaeum sp.]|uniref:thrombospondin type 3 repeat-containing protein n=1 Tax=Nitrosarchaeum sp. TaxID=2026886 RepID=UPI002DED0094